MEQSALERHWSETHGAASASAAIGSGQGAAVGEDGPQRKRRRRETSSEDNPVVMGPHTSSYGCDLCSRAFPLRGHLLRHLRSEEHREREAQQAVQTIISDVRRQVFPLKISFNVYR